MYNKLKLRDKAKISILIAVSVISMYFKIVLPIFPTFLSFDISDIPIFFISLVFSPILGVFSMGIKNILSILFMGSFTYGIGEITNFLLGSCFVFSSSYVFLRTSGFKKYILSFLFGSIILIVFGSLLNYFIILPVYVKILGISIDNIVGEYGIFKFFTVYLVLYNLIKSIIIFLPTIFIFNKFKKINSRINS